MAASKETKQENPSPKVRERKEFKFPAGYGDNKIVLLVRDPWWMFTYWEIRREKEEEIQRKIADVGDAAEKSILRVYDVTDVAFNGSNAHSFFDIELKGLASSWYVNVNQDRAWVVDIGILTKKGAFFVLARSNVARTPRFGMSDQLDAEWMAQEEEYWRLFGLSGGFGVGKGSLEAREMVRKHLEEQVTSGIVSSGASFYRKPAAGRKFWMVVNCELIVYGATEPDADVTVQGKKIQLRPDGTFSFRYALPDGKQEIPVVATSSDKVETRRITPIVTRRTE